MILTLWPKSCPLGEVQGIFSALPLPVIFSELEDVSAANDDRLRRWQEWALNRFIFPLAVLVFDQLSVRVPRMEIRYRLL